MPNPDGTPTPHNARLTGKTSHGSKTAAPSSFEMNDGVHSVTNLTGAKSAPFTTARAADDHSDSEDDTASDDSTFRKAMRRSCSEYTEEPDLESGPIDGVRVETTYDVRPASAHMMAEQTIAVQRSGRDLHTRRFWDRDWQNRRLGNSVTIGNDESTGNRR